MAGPGARAVSFRVTGKVQGVSFRAWTQAEAERRGLSGWVRNDPRGSVSGWLQGPAAQVASMLRALGEGPAAARVEDVWSQDVPLEAGLHGFEIRR